MDPDAVLAALREDTAALLSGNNVEIEDVDTYQYAERFKALDDWITMGGFLPRAWKEL
jgi:hypothetical protein